MSLWLLCFVVRLFLHPCTDAKANELHEQHDKDNTSAADRRHHIQQLSRKSPRKHIARYCIQCWCCYQTYVNKQSTLHEYVHAFNCPCLESHAFMPINTQGRTGHRRDFAYGLGWLNLGWTGCAFAAWAGLAGTGLAWLQNQAADGNSVRQLTQQMRFATN